MDQHIPNDLKTLHNIYTNKESPIFLEQNINRILQFTKKNAQLDHYSRNDILRYKQHLTELSRGRETRILRNRRRYLSYRRWIVWAPLHISKCQKSTLGSAVPLPYLFM